MKEFEVLTTPEQELAVFLTDIGVPVRLVQQGGAVEVTLSVSKQESALIMGDREQAGLWHVVDSRGFRGFVTGTYSLLVVLHGSGCTALTGEPWYVIRQRYAKARRILAHFDDNVHNWRNRLGETGEKPSLYTIRIIEQLLKEET